MDNGILHTFPFSHHIFSLEFMGACAIFCFLQASPAYLAQKGEMIN